MRPTLIPLFALILPALFFVGCPNFGSSTGLASGGDAAVAADTIIDTVSEAAASDPVPVEPVVVSPNADSAVTVAVETANPAPDSSKPVAAVSTADSAKPEVEAPNADSAEPLRKPVVAVADPAVPDPVPATPVLPAVEPVAVSPVAPAVVPAVDPAQASRVFLNTDFESESLECWNGNRTATSANRAGCGQFKSIGFTPFALAQNGITHSGSKAIDITYTKNEEMGGTNVGISADSVNVRAWYYFEPGFDFGQGLKIGRVSSFNTAKQLNDVDIILEVRSSGKNQCGVTDMADVGLFFNGAPKGYDWGNAAANISFQRGRWYAVEYQVVLNNPGRSDGAVRLWVDGQQVAARTGLNIRGTAGTDAKLNTVKIGGWYSNAANGNSCANPSQPSKLHMDDVAIATSYIGLGAPVGLDAPDAVAAR